MKPGDLSAAVSRIETAISQIEAKVARMNGTLPANEVPGSVPRAHVPTVDPADELLADSRMLLPHVDLSECNVVLLSALRRCSKRTRPVVIRLSRKRTGSAQ